MVRYFFGDDSWAAKQAIDQLAIDQDARVRILERRDFDERPAQVWLRDSSRGLFGRDLLVVRAVSSLPRGIQDELLATVDEDKSEGILWDAQMPDKRSKLYKTLGREGSEFRLPGRAQLADWLISEAERRGGHLEPRAAATLVERAGRDRWRLLSELERLLLLDDRITDEQVRSEVATVEQSEDVFALLAALLEGDSATVFKRALALLAQGHSEFYLLSMLAYQFRTLLVVRKGVDRGYSVDQVAQKGKLKPFVVQKNMPTARRRPAAYWRDALTRVLAVDVAIRQGRVEARTGLLMLLTGLV